MPRAAAPGVEPRLDFIESKRTAELWTDLECDIEYTRLSRRFPIFKNAVDNPKGARKAIAEERARRAT